VFAGLERCPLCIMLDGVACAHKAECRKASKPLTAFETGRAETSSPLWVYCRLLHPQISIKGVVHFLKKTFVDNLLTPMPSKMSMSFFLQSKRN